MKKEYQGHTSTKDFTNKKDGFRRLRTKISITERNTMSIFVSNIVWHDAKLMSPAEDGTYLVVTGWSVNDVSTMLYTTEGGWNTYRDKDGLHADRALSTEDGYIRLWTAMPTVEEVRVVDEAERRDL